MCILCCSLLELEYTEHRADICYSWARIPGLQDDVVLKLLSVNHAEYPDAPAEGIRQILELASGKSIPRGVPLDLALIKSIRMGTTVATKYA